MKFNGDKIKMTPTQGAILRILEEAGEEDFCSLLNTLVVLDATQQDEVLVAQFLDDVTILMQLGLIVVTKYRYTDSRLETGDFVDVGDLYQRVGTSLQVDDQEGGWKWAGETRLNVELASMPIS